MSQQNATQSTKSSRDKTDTVNNETPGEKTPQKGFYWLFKHPSLNTLLIIVICLVACFLMLENIYSVSPLTTHGQSHEAPEDNNFSEQKTNDIQEVWQLQQTEKLAQLNKTLQKNKVEQQQNTEQLQALKTMVEVMRISDKEKKANVSQSAATVSTQKKNQSVARDSYNDLPIKSATHRKASWLAETQLSLVTHPKSTSAKPTIPYFPAGTFARAVLLGGVDAPANTLSQTNPEPILLRFLGDAVLPNHDTLPLTGCVATGAVVGDISSERGHIRLERLSCRLSGRKTVDIAVQGTVLGQDGKNGVRGLPAWREGKRLERATLAGFLSGVAKELHPTKNAKNLLQSGALEGSQTALDKLAAYHIKRAETYHPIIQIQAGTEVDVLFLKGFFLSTLSHKHRSY